MFPKILSKYLRERRVLRRARMKRLRFSNTVVIMLLFLMIPIYPVFGSVLYDGSRRTALGYPIDEDSIIAEYTSEDAFIAPDTPIRPDSDWKGRTKVETYIVQPGDTMSELAESFGITRDTIRWSNNLASNTLRVGQKLIIPPADGVVYVTKNGDTLDAIARKYNTTVQKIESFNALGSVLPIGMSLFLPDGKQPSPPVSPSAISGTYALTVVNPGGAGFVPGQCTYFVAKHWPVKWRGHARYWFKNANAAGFRTGQTAKPGAIVVWYGPGYNLTYGHVGIVMSVNAKAGTMVVKDMNYAGPWKVTTRVEKIKNKYIVGFIYNEKK